MDVSASSPGNVFVYGTLKRGECREQCWPHPPLAIFEATIEAILYDLGPYPAIAPGTGIVLGELWQLAPEHVKHTLEILDAIEGYCGSEHDLYQRRIVPCKLANGDVHPAWTYFYGDQVAVHCYRRVLPSRDGASTWSRCV